MLHLLPLFSYCNKVTISHWLHFQQADDVVSELDLSKVELNDPRCASGLHYSIEEIPVGANYAALSHCLSKNSKLRVLILSDSSLGPFGMQELVKGLEHNTTVTSLTLDGCFLRSSGAATLSYLLRLSNLKLTFVAAI